VSMKVRENLLGRGKACQMGIGENRGAGGKTPVEARGVRMKEKAEDHGSGRGKIRKLLLPKEKHEPKAGDQKKKTP